MTFSSLIETNRAGHITHLAGFVGTSEDGDPPAFLVFFQKGSRRVEQWHEMGNVYYAVGPEWFYYLLFGLTDGLVKHADAKTAEQVREALADLYASMADAGLNPPVGAAVGVCGVRLLVTFYTTTTAGR